MRKPWSVLGFAWSARVFALLALCLFPTAVLAATTYDFSTKFPVCNGSTWQIVGTTHTCPGSISLGDGDSILPLSSITVVARAGIGLSANNTVGSATVTVNLQSDWGGITASNTNKTSLFYGSLTSGSGAINLTGASVTGSISTNGTINLNGGSVSGDVSGRNGVAANGGTLVGGNVAANSGSISLAGGSVMGSVSSACCGVTTSNTNVGNGVSSASGTVQITGGTISGNISSGGGAGISITGATVASGSITAANVAINISASTIGSPSSPVNVTGNNWVGLVDSTTVYGNVTAGGWPGALWGDWSGKVYGACNPNPILNIVQCNAVPLGPDHVRVFLNNNATALTCAPRTVDAIACRDSGCSARYGSTVGVVLSPGGTAATIPVGGTGTPTVSMSSAGSTAITLASSSPAAVGATKFRCYSGTVSSPGNEVTGACNLTFSTAGFFVSVPNHVSCGTQTLTITAAKSDDKSKRCVPAFDNGASRDINLRFAYANPINGNTAPSVGSPASDLKTNTDTKLALVFNNGVATTNFQYKDAGSLTVLASYTGSSTTGDAGLSMATVSNPAFVVAPASFAISNIPAAPLTAGTPFPITVTARNSCNGTTENFGQETPAATVLLTSSNPTPGMGNATAISQTLTGFTKGAASTTLKWNEVGTIDVAASTTAYLGSSLGVTGSQAAVGRFKPAYFDTVVTPGCGSAFTYAGLSGTTVIAGQPFSVEVKAKRSGGDSNDTTNTANYAGATWAKAVTLSDANSGSGTLANNSFSATDFSSGKAKRADVTYAMASKLTAPYTLAIRASDSDGVSSSGHAEGGTVTRSGRLWFGNAYGSERTSLSLPYETQYWNGFAFVRNTDDVCTVLNLANVGLGNYQGSVNSTNLPVDSITVNAITPLDPGVGSVLLAAPNAGGSADVVLRLNPTLSMCPGWVPTYPGGTPTTADHLRSSWCGSTPNDDPVARATFGISKSSRQIYLRENF